MDSLSLPPNLRFRLLRLCVLFGALLVVIGSNVVVGAEDNGRNASIHGLEFNGYIQMKNSLRFCFHDKSEGRTFWLNENQTVNGLQIRSWDASSETLVVASGGVTRSLSLIKDRIKRLELRSLEEIRTDPVVMERNKRQAKAVEFAGDDQLIGYLIRSEKDKEARRKARELEMLRELRKD